MALNECDGRRKAAGVESGGRRKGSFVLVQALIE
jgi:hypothetical protein